jgi:hypothetical protein
MNTILFDKRMSDSGHRPIRIQRGKNEVHPTEEKRRRLLRPC